MNGLHRTNNVSEGWHNRFNLLAGKVHPDFYSFLRLLRAEQKEVETLLVEVAMARAVRAPKRRKYVALEERISDIVTSYETYRDDGRLLDYLRCLGHNITLT